jgi:hypothetical protein
MYCPNCECEYIGWIVRCPVCRSVLIEGLPSEPETVEPTMSYGQLVDLVGAKGGKLQIEVAATEVGMEKDWGFPFFAFGFAWAKRMQGACDGISVDLRCSDVKKEKELRFPYLGYGFAWVNSLQGTINGTEVFLAAKKVVREKKWRFPYFAYGFAWTEMMSGTCGEKLKADLVITEVGKKWQQRYLYLGYGFAWEKKGMLTLSRISN